MEKAHIWALLSAVASMSVWVAWRRYKLWAEEQEWQHRARLYDDKSL